MFPLYCLGAYVQGSVPSMLELRLRKNRVRRCVCAAVVVKSKLAPLAGRDAPPHPAAQPRTGSLSSELVSFWSEMYGSTLRRTRSFRLLERIFLNKLVFKEKDHFICPLDDFESLQPSPLKSAVSRL